MCVCVCVCQAWAGGITKVASRSCDCYQDGATPPDARTAMDDPWFGVARAHCPYSLYHCQRWPRQLGNVVVGPRRVEPEVQHFAGDGPLLSDIQVGYDEAFFAVSGGDTNGDFTVRDSPGFRAAVV